MTIDLATEMYRERTDALVTERGDGPPVVFAHGALMDRTMFRPQLRALSEEYRVAAYDLRARTEHWMGPYDLSDLADDCEALLDALDVQSPVFVGMSMGGFIGLELALHRSVDLSGLVLVDSMAAPHPPDEREQYGEMVEPLTRLAMLPRRLAEDTADILFGQTTVEEQPDLVAKWVDRWRTYPPEAIYHEVHSWLDREGYEDRLDDLDVPTLVVHGEEDEGIAPEQAIPVAEAASDGRVELIPEAGHGANVEQPEAVNEALRDFLSDVY